MTMPTRSFHAARSLASNLFRPLRVVQRNVGRAVLNVSHNSFALIGFVLVGAAAFTGSNPTLRHELETHALGWLQARHAAPAEPLSAASPVVEAEAAPIVVDEPEAVARATATDPRELSRQQASIAQWLSRRYKVALEPVGRLVQEAWAAGARNRLDPTLILAIMAIESSFNPFAQSSVGAQGLMQVMTKVHNDKYEPFGGRHAAFDPVTNVRVGVQVLKECIARAGSIERGLRFYVGAANLADDGGYAGKVLREQNSLRQVAGMPPLPPPVVATVRATSVGSDVAPSRPAPPVIQPAVAEPSAEPPVPEQLAMLLLR